MIKTIDIKSLLIGSLLAIVIMLFLGLTSNGRYQAYTTTSKSGKSYPYMLDTRTGDAYRISFSDTGEPWTKSTKDGIVTPIEDNDIKLHPPPSRRGES